MEVEQDESKLEVEEITVDESDYYSVLGVPHDATEKQISIAYKKLFLKYNPERQTDDSNAEHVAKRFAAIQEAHDVLSDTHKRRQYDLKNDKLSHNDREAADATPLGGIGRVFGAVINRLGLPTASQISTDVVVSAQEICRDGGIEGGGPPLDPRVSDLPWGWSVEGRVDRQSGAFYRLTVDAANAEKGFVVHCRSANKSKFKLLLFDCVGALLHQEDSLRARDGGYTQCSFFFTQFDTFRLDESKARDKASPALFQRLDSLAPSRRHAAPGQYLLCVYGDNFIGKTSFSVVAVPAKADLPLVRRLEETDEQLLDLKRVLESTKSEYAAAKAAYDAVLDKMKVEEERLNELLCDREKNYTGVVDHAIAAFNPLDTTTHNPAAHPNADNVPPEDAAEKDHEPAPAGGLFGFFGSAATTATTVGTSAAQTATAATGWLARRLSLIVQPVATAEEGVAVSSAAPTQPSEPVGAEMDRETRAEDAPLSIAAAETAPPSTEVVAEEEDPQRAFSPVPKDAVDNVVNSAAGPADENELMDETL